MSILCSKLPWAAACLTAAALAADSAAAQCQTATVAGAANDRFGDRLTAVGDIDADGWNDVAVYAAGTLGPAYLELRSGRTSAVIHRITYAAFSIGRPSVDSAGDIDGDGHGDILLGEPMYTAGSVAEVGRVRVLSGADLSVMLEVTGSSWFGYLGHSVAWLGDVDGDGHGDFAAGEPGEGSNGGLNGAVHLYSGATGTRLHTQFGELRDRMGTAVRNAGDINADGVNDVLVGVPYADHSYVDQGSAFVYSGVDLGVLRHHMGWATADAMGTAVVGVGDWNGDGRADYAVGAPQAFGSGVVMVVSGKTGLNLAWLNGGFAGVSFGQVLAAGDLDGDGKAELAVGNPHTSSAGFATGSVDVYAAPWGAFRDGYAGSAAYETFGASIAIPGDLNGDGRGELLIGAPGAAHNGPSSGKVVAYVCDGLRMEPIAPAIAGQQNQLAARGAIPGATIAFHASLQLGSAPVPGCAGLNLGLASPTNLGIAVANPQGEANMTMQVPATAHGRVVVLQASDAAGCEVSRPLLQVFF